MINWGENGAFAELRFHPLAPLVREPIFAEPQDHHQSFYLNRFSIPSNLDSIFLFFRTFQDSNTALKYLYESFRTPQYQFRSLVAFLLRKSESGHLKYFISIFRYPKQSANIITTTSNLFLKHFLKNPFQSERWIWGWFWLKMGKRRILADLFDFFAFL